MQKDRNVGSFWAGCPSERRGKRQRETSASETLSCSVGGRTFLLTVSYGWGSRNSAIPRPCPTHGRRQELQGASADLPANASPQERPQSSAAGGGTLGGVPGVQEESQRHQPELDQQSRGRPGRGWDGGSHTAAGAVGLCCRTCFLSHRGPRDTWAGPLPWGPSRRWPRAPPSVSVVTADLSSACLCDCVLLSL